MSLSSLLASIQPLVAEKLAEKAPLAPAHPAHVLFFSVCDGAQRARICIATGKTFDAAWKSGVAHCQRIASTRKLEARWLRVDWVTSVAPTTWQNLTDELAKTKRNYFRYGLALDAGFEKAFLEQELNANAMLYGSSEVASAKLNSNNFLKYARERFGDFQPAFSPDNPVWRFASEGVFASSDPDIQELPGGTTPQHIPPPAVTAQVAWNAPATLDSGRRAIAHLDSASTLSLIRSSSEFLARQVLKNGKFIYGHFPCFGRQIATYNTLRHASSVYSMLEAWELTRSNTLMAAIERAISYLVDTLIRRYPQPDGGTMAFNVDINGEVKLGANAVSLLALVKYDELTGKQTYRPLMESLALGIAHMQDRDSGKFVHVLNAADLSVKDAFRIIYYDGEAAFGLMRLYGLTQDARWLSIVEKAFDHFIAARHWKAHDHWLSYCANELTRYKPEEKYFRFGVQNIAGHLDFILQRETTYPTLLELSMAFEQMLGRIQQLPEMRHVLDGLDIDKFHRALHHRAHYLLNGFFWPELAMYFAKPNTVVGSFFIRHHTFRVRIDDIEHYLSGYVAYWKMLQQATDDRETPSIETKGTLAQDPADEGPTVAWGGDVNLGRRQHYRTTELGHDTVMRIPALSAADVTIVNLECVVSTKGEQGVDKGEGGPYYYRARPEMLHILMSAGVDIVATANNHSGDYGTAALLQQNTLLDAIGIGHAGSGNNLEQAFAPAIRRAGDLNIAVFSVDATKPMFAAHSDSPGSAYLPLNDPRLWREQLAQRFAAAHDQVDIVLVAVHWRPNVVALPSPEEVAVAHTLIDIGADAVLGASVHALRGIEIYRDRPIIYDAGNLLFDSVQRRLSDGGIFRLLLSNAGVKRITFVPVGISFGFSQQYFDADAISASKRFAKQCAAVGTDLTLTARGSAYIDLDPPARPKPTYPLTIPTPAQLTALEEQTFFAEPQWQTERVPPDAQIESVHLGPLTLLGIRVQPQALKRRRMLWVESFWRAADTPIEEDIRIDIQAVPISPTSMRPWGEGMDHDPCDWMMPTSRWQAGCIYRDFYGLRPPYLRDWDNVELQLTVNIVSTKYAVEPVQLPIFIRLSADLKDSSTSLAAVQIATQKAQRSDPGMPHSSVDTSPSLSHRLFIDVLLSDDRKRGKTPRRDLRWAHTMDVAITRAVLALTFGMEPGEANDAYESFITSLPRRGEEGCMSSAAEKRLRRFNLAHTGPWSVEEICHFILGLEHRLYAFKHEYEKWQQSRFKSVPIALLRGSGRSVTPHGISLYRAYQQRLMVGTVQEKLAPLQLQKGAWHSVTGPEKLIELTCTNDTHWLHTDARELPGIWALLDDLVQTLKGIDTTGCSNAALQTSVGLIAQVHWWFSHATPYRRGSAAVSDMLTKTLLQYCQISTPCWRKGVAPDLEAFCTPLDEFVNIYPSLFVSPPLFINQEYRE